MVTEAIAIELCRAVMPFGDDHGDNTCSFRCMLPINHDGRHKEWGNLYGKYPYSLEWEGDYRDEMTYMFFWGQEIEKSVSQFKDIAERLELVYTIKEEYGEFGGDVWIELDGHSKERYFAEVERQDCECDAV